MPARWDEKVPPLRGLALWSTVSGGRVILRGTLPYVGVQATLQFERRMSPHAARRLAHELINAARHAEEAK